MISPKPDNRIDELQALKLGLAEFPVHETPSALFRYLRGDNLRALTEGLINLTPPKYFNDPFEMWAGIAPETLTEEKMIRSVTAPNGIFRQTLEVHDENYRRNPEDYLRQLTSHVRKSPQTWPPHLRSIVNAIQSLTWEHLGVACFSGFTSDDFLGEAGIRHWAAYANDFRGLSIEYDGKHRFFKEISEHKWLFPVEYREKRLLVDLDEFDEWNNAKMWRALRLWLAMKSQRAWGNESEWRIVHPLGTTMNRNEYRYEGEGKNRRYFLSLWPKGEPQPDGVSAIRRIWLGYRAPQKLRKAVVEICAHPAFKHVEISTALPDEREYALRPLRLHPEDITAPDYLRAMARVDYE